MLKLTRHFCHLKDISKFILIFLIIYAGYSLALNNLYWYYNSQVRGSVEFTDHVNVNDGNSTITKAEVQFGT